jgi:hypothetical protein
MPLQKGAERGARIVFRLYFAMPGSGTRHPVARLCAANARRGPRVSRVASALYFATAVSERVLIPDCSLQQLTAKPLQNRLLFAET